MAGVTHEQLAVARVYSTAMLELAQAQGEADSLREELLDLVAYLDRSPEFDSFLARPTVDVAARRESIEKVLRGRASDLLVDALQVLNRKERLGLLRGIAETYRLAHQEMRGLVDVHVVTAAPLSETFRGKLKEITTSYTGKEARLVETVDESIIGGMIVRVGDEKFDTSVSSRLKKLSDSLAQRASHEVHGGKTYVAEAEG